MHGKLDLRLLWTSSQFHRMTRKPGRRGNPSPGRILAMAAMHAAGGGSRVAGFAFWVPQIDRHLEKGKGEDLRIPIGVIGPEMLPARVRVGVLKRKRDLIAGSLGTKPDSEFSLPNSNLVSGRQPPPWTSSSAQPRTLLASIRMVHPADFYTPRRCPELQEWKTVACRFFPSPRGPPR
ncbi:hypothetical protein BO70DRAFT_54805 [Aspergillus heteromorphus CBS 117.55]|uniref:Uncharacterized protein n=1 Tax=Aspergillus heteromorphus CBS 117.55 TaxID=1448321 RepID=A0A317W0J3_9EURO|nr:uncharacterized protein BO70DRAFT_54805 [Aspergillus heteromorphus CBS 117.55]PWY79131.1 hypothetical protein BO70DRAFT_54805 [Aspergillus heteromorphus CBS 117.55]